MPLLLETLAHARLEPAWSPAHASLDSPGMPWGNRRPQLLLRLHGTDCGVTPRRTHSGHCTLQATALHRHSRKAAQQPRARHQEGGVGPTSKPYGSQQSSWVPLKLGNRLGGSHPAGASAEEQLCYLRSAQGRHVARGQREEAAGEVAQAAEGEGGELDCVGSGISVECITHFPDSDSEDTGSKVLANGSAASASSANGSAVEDGNGAVTRAGAVPGADKSTTADVTVSATAAELLGTVGSTLLLVSPFFFWGSSMVAMKDVLPRAGPMFVAAFRLIPAGGLLVAFAAARGRAMPSSATAWIAIIAFAAVDATAFQGFLSEGLRRTSAGLGSVIIDSQPLTVAVLASLLFGEYLGPRGVAGLLLGVFGLCLLEIPGDVLTDLLAPMAALGGGGVALAPMVGGGVLAVDPAAATGGAEWSIWESGEWWMLLAAQSMAVGTVMVRWVCQHCDPIMATGWHLMLGGLPLLALSFAQSDPAVLPGGLAELSALDWSLLAYTSVFGSAVSYGVFFYNANRGNLTKLSSLTFLTPAFASLFGFLFLSETLNEQQIFGALVTVGAIYLVNTQQSDA